MPTIEDNDDDKTRLSVEIELLGAMYPDSIFFRPQNHEFSYIPVNSSPACLRLSIPTTYPSIVLPTILSAQNNLKHDIKLKLAEATAALQDGQEALDAIIEAFNDIIFTASTTSSSITSTVVEKKKTVIIWLHHLLNTNKRKQVLAPSQPLTGVSKPGYPGILIFSGPADAVGRHIHELKQLNWQAFQVRYETQQVWDFVGLREVETIADVVKSIGERERERERKEVFMEAMRMK